MKLGVCSGADRKTLEAAARIGYTGTNTSIPGKGSWKARARRFKKLLDDTGMEAAAINTPFRVDGVRGNEAELPKFCDAVVELGCTKLRTFVPPYIRQPEGDVVDFWTQVDRARADLRIWERELRRTGLQLCIETHDGYIVAGAASSYLLLQGLDPAWVGIVHDAENMVREGFSHWTKQMEIIGRYIGFLHVKNMVWEAVTEVDEGYWDMPHNHRKWRPARAALADGLVDWPGLIKALHVHGFDGYLCIEDMRKDLDRDVMWQEDYDYLSGVLAGLGK